MAYIIQKGDTLSQIAKRNNTSVQEIAALNDISNPNLIRAGSTLKLPGSAATVPTEVQEPEVVPLSNQDILRQLTEYVSTPYSPGDISAGYNSAIAQRQAALQQSKALAQTQANAQTEQLRQAYEQARKQVYVNSRLNAIGNNEALASLGLAGSAYESPQSGYSESSRVAQDVALRSDIAETTRQEQAQIDALAQAIIEQGITADMEYAQWLAEMQIEQANAIAAAQQQDYQNKLNILGQIAGLNQQEFANQQTLLANQPKGTGKKAVDDPIDWQYYIDSLSDGEKRTLFSGTGLTSQSVLNSMRDELGSKAVQALQVVYGGVKYQDQLNRSNRLTPTTTLPGGYTGVKKATQ